jgi:hypothetical protein
VIRPKRTAGAAPWDSLLLALRDPAAMAGFKPDTWDPVVRQARAAGLLGRLAALARGAGVDDALPVSVRHHLRASLTLAEQQQRAVRWELVQLSATLAGIDGPVVLLKGAAYAAAGQAPAPGRLFSDIDLLVPRAQLDATEAALMLGGWNSSHHDRYDQRYYRQWMHELPPMMHIKRQTVLDLHHNILPETARIKTRPDLILAASRPLAEFPRFNIPDPVDLVLHSATHLFHEGEWQHGLRDLVDLDALLRDHGREPAFWDRLFERAVLLNLGRPLFYGLRYCSRLLRTPCPADWISRCPNRPGAIGSALMDRLFVPAFATAHHSLRNRLSAPATFGLYVRSHWLRMPLPLLLPHLARKSWKKRVEALFAKPAGDPGDAAGGAGGLP